MNISPIYQSLIDDLNNKFGDHIIEVSENQGNVIIRVSLSEVHDILRHLYDEHRFVYLVDLIGTDRFTSDERFEVIYNMLSLRDQIRVFVKIRCEEEDPHVPTVTDIWRGANWHEREVYDMFGIIFDGHPDLRRMYLPEDFQYFPLRKEFPLLGIPGSLDLPNTTPDVED